MASGSIKGITIEFRGDTTKLDKALKQVNKESASIQKELTAVNKALKFNPTSVELWRQKQELLTKKISETEDKLKLLKRQQAEMDAAGVDKTSVEYQRLQREIIETESKLKTFKAELKSIGNVNLRAASEQFKELGNNLTKAGEAMKGFSVAGAAAVAAIGALAYKGGQLADDLNTLSKRYSIATEDLQMYAAAAELVDVDVETIAKSHVRLEKQMLSAANGSKQTAAYFDLLGVSVTDANGNLREGDAVWQDVIRALGEMENETERDAVAMALMGRSASELNPLIEDGGETYQKMAETLAKYDLEFIDQDTLDAANEFNDSLDTMKAMATVALSTVSTQLAAYLAPALEKVVDWVGRFAQWLSNLDPRLLTIIAAIGGVIAVVSPLLIGLGKLSFAISSILSLMATIGPAIAGVLSAAAPIVLAIGAIIAVGITLYKNWDTIKAKAVELWNKIKEVFEGIRTNVTNKINAVKSFLSGAWNSIKKTASTVWEGIKTAILTPIQSARETISGIIEKIKGFFPIRVGRILSNLKLPHFNLSGSFSLVPPKVPKISVDWYKTGGIFDSASIVGIGEAGPEAVVPLDTLWNKLDKIAAASASGGDGVTINVYGTPGMNVNELAAAVEKRLVMLQQQRQKAWQ